MNGTTVKLPQKKGLLHKIITQKELIIIALPFFIYIFVFSYMPLWGLTMAFQNFKPWLSFSEQEWVGIAHFQKLFDDTFFYNALRNTIAMSLINLVLSFVTAIGFALLVNELVFIKYKKVVQTISYLPHFLSWIIVCGLLATMLSMDNGIINETLIALRIIDEPIHFLGRPDMFWWLYGISNVWKSVGWNSIIYLAAIMSIDPALYEAAAMDGCGRFKRMWHVTLPGIKPTIIILLIMNAGWMLNTNFEFPYILGQNGLVLEVSETLDLYVLRKGFGAGTSGFAFGTAAGMFKTVISIIILTISNTIAGAFGDDKLV